jgi:hypothetical protein
MIQFRYNCLILDYFYLPFYIRLLYIKPLLLKIVNIGLKLEFIMIGEIYLMAVCLR